MEEKELEKQRRNEAAQRRLKVMEGQNMSKEKENPELVQPTAAEKAAAAEKEKAAAEKAKQKAAEKARKAEEKARAKAEEEKIKAEEKARAKAEKERLKAEEVARKEAEEKARKEAEEKAKREAEAKAKAEAEEKTKAEAEAKAKSEAEAKTRAEAEAAKAKTEAEERAKVAEAEKQRQEQEQKQKQEAEKAAAEKAEVKPAVTEEKKEEIIKSAQQAQREGGATETTVAQGAEVVDELQEQLGGTARKQGAQASVAEEKQPEEAPTQEKTEEAVQVQPPVEQPEGIEGAEEAQPTQPEPAQEAEQIQPPEEQPEAPEGREETEAVEEVKEAEVVETEEEKAAREAVVGEEVPAEEKPAEPAQEETLVAFSNRLADAIAQSNLDGLNEVLKGKLTTEKSAAVNEAYVATFKSMLASSTVSDAEMATLGALHAKVVRPLSSDRQEELNSKITGLPVHEFSTVGMDRYVLVKGRNQSMQEFYGNIKQAQARKEARDLNPSPDEPDVVEKGYRDQFGNLYREEDGKRVYYTPPQPVYYPPPQPNVGPRAEGREGREDVPPSKPEQVTPAAPEGVAVAQTVVENTGAGAGVQPEPEPQPQPQPLARTPQQPGEADNIAQLKARIEAFTKKSPYQLTLAELEDPKNNNPEARKALIRAQLLRNMKSGEPTDQNAKDLLSEKANEIYKKFYDESGKAIEGKTDTALNETLDEVCKPILLQAYLCQKSGRPYDVTQEGDAKAVKRYEGDAVDAFARGGITSKNIEDALVFEGNQKTWGTWGNAGYKVGRTLSWLAYAPARVPGNIANNIKEYVSENPLPTALMGVSVLVGVSLFFPGALPFALLYGSAAVLITAVAAAVGAINDTGPGKIAFKAMGTLVTFPLDLAVTLMVGVAATVSSILTGKTILETMDDIGYKPFALGRAILSNPETPQEKKFSDSYNKSSPDITKEKDGILASLNALQPEEMEKALGDKTISNHMKAEGILKDKLQEFFDRNPSEAQVKTMLNGNPELQNFIKADPLLAAHASVAPVLQQLQPQPGVDAAALAQQQAQREAAGALAENARNAAAQPRPTNEQLEVQQRLAEERRNAGQGRS